jgi:hypothetical protein
MQIYNDVLFDSVAFSSITGLTVLAINPYLPAKRNVTIAEIARTDTSKVNSTFYTSKQISIRVGLSGRTRRDVEQVLDNLLSIIQGEEKWLVVPQSSGTRKYLTTYKDYDVIQDGGSYIELSLQFECSDRFGYDVDATPLLTVTNYTGATKSDQIGIAGSAQWQVPRFSLTIGAVTGGTAKTISYGNTAVGQQVDITRDWLAGDTLVIDAYDHSVKVNGNDIDFSGAIPEWSPGTGNVYYQDNFTTRTVSYSLTYRRRWV